MRTKCCAAFVLVWLISAALGPLFAQQADIAVVVNEKNPTTSMRSTELRQIFAGEKHSWANGQAIKVFVRASGARERAVLLGLLGMTESEYKKYWAEQVFRGEAQTEPAALFSNGMQKEAVMAYPGAIALIDVRDVKPGMKVLKLDGHAPGDADYRLH
jgi:ABC-type phosphate transport system substrate-binding protein